MHLAAVIRCLSDNDAAADALIVAQVYGSASHGWRVCGQVSTLLRHHQLLADEPARNVLAEG